MSHTDNITCNMRVCANAPLPDRELAELERAVGALGAIGRNLNQYRASGPLLILPKCVAVQ